MSFSPPSKTKKQSSRQSEFALALADCLAKTYCGENGQHLAGRSVLSHCLIVGNVARSLISRTPHWLKNDLFPTGSEIIAAAHDIGKVSPTFQEKIRRGRRNSSAYICNSLHGLETAEPEQEKQWGGHAGVSQITAHSCSIGRYIPEILGQHHGYSPNVAIYDATDPCFGGEPWQVRRRELIDAIKKSMDCDWPNVKSALHARVLAGLTTVADWIGSGPQFDDPNNENWLLNIEGALDDAGFVSPRLHRGLLFKQIFGFEPRSAQQKLIDACHEPGVYILEAPMGIGKTEAALYAAYKMMALGKATGIYFALPTQLTSDKIHDRMNQFLRKIVDPSCPHRNALLLHSNAWLKATEMGEEAQPGGSWFQARKRGILAPFGVGTIDQALMAVMNVKHGFVRTFGLAGKVVILDEVHSYDSYTGTILDTLIEALRELSCTVIILSATLTLERRRILLKEDPKNREYPLISSSSLTGFQEVAIAPPSDAKVAINLCQDDSIAIEEALRRAEEGQQVLWIENTVAEAQEQFKLLAAKSSEISNKVVCGLLHSRFLKCDRQAIEEEWVTLFGRENAAKREEHGRILIGTQVLEQSLDIDADFLVSRMCPTDMLLQRMGRLWRHNETARPSTAKREAWLLAPELGFAVENPKQAFGKSARVYDPYVLIRSLEVWSPINSVLLPNNIRNLIEATYEPRIEKDVVKRALQQQLNEHRAKLKGLAQVGLSQGGKTLSESKANTRHSEQDTVEVLLIQFYKRTQYGTRVTFVSGDAIDLFANAKSKNSHENRKLSAVLMQNTVRVAAHLAPTPLPLNQLEWLKDYLYLGDENEEEGLLRVAKVHPSGKLVSLDGAVDANDTRYLSYNPTLGYQSDQNL